MFKFFLSNLIALIDALFMLFQSIGIFVFSLILLIIVLIVIGCFFITLFTVQYVTATQIFIAILYDKGLS